MSATQPELFTDQSGANTGSALAQPLFNALVVGQDCLVAGTLPTSSGNMNLTVPTTEPTLDVIINPGTGVAAFLKVAQQVIAISGSGNQDVYVYVNTAGVYSQIAVTHGAGAPATPAGKMPLFYATTNSGGTAIASVTQVASPFALTPSAIAVADETSGLGTTYARTDSLQQTIARLVDRLHSLENPTTGGGGTPGITAGGTGVLGVSGTATLASGSTDDRGAVNIYISGGYSIAGIMATIAFSTPSPTKPSVVISPLDAGFWVSQPYYTLTGGSGNWTGFLLSNSALSSLVTSIAYHVDF